MSDAARLQAERERAEALLADLHRELVAIAESTAGVPDDEHDAEGSTVAYERARVQALLAQAERVHADLVTAGDRLALGTYRRCEHCGEEIPAERLAALPATRSCVSCAHGWGGHPHPPYPRAKASSAAPRLAPSSMPIPVQSPTV